MALTATETKARIDAIIDGYRTATSASPNSVVPPSLTAGKVYEAWVLCSVLEMLHTVERYSVVLRQSNRIVLKSSPSGINRSYPYFDLAHPNRKSLEIWTDIEFLSLSYSHRSDGRAAQLGDYHELDIVAVPAGLTGRPRHDQIRLGVECKNTGYTKELLRGILGVRRELSYLVKPINTEFNSWPGRTVPASPPSCLLVYSTDPLVALYSSSGEAFGIDFRYEPLP
jgi:hypothetical protein